jgi:hypothetical protein
MSEFGSSGARDGIEVAQKHGVFSCPVYKKIVVALFEPASRVWVDCEIARPVTAGLRDARSTSQSRHGSSDESIHGRVAGQVGISAEKRAADYLYCDNHSYRISKYVVVNCRNKKCGSPFAPGRRRPNCRLAVRG